MAVKNENHPYTSAAFKPSNRDNFNEVKFLPAFVNKLINESFQIGECYEFQI